MEESSSGQAPRCPCGFWGSAKTSGLCSKCYKEYISQSKENLNASDIGSAQVSQTKAGRSSKMDSKHCPSRSSTDKLSSQTSCASQQADHNLANMNDQQDTSHPSIATTPPAMDDRTVASSEEIGCNRLSPVANTEDGKVTETDCVVVGMSSREDCASDLQTVEPQVVGSCQRSADSSVDSSSPRLTGGMSSKERLSAVDDSIQKPSDSQGKTDLSKEVDTTLTSAETGESRQPQGTKRTHNELEAEESSPELVKQKNKKRCFKCSCKLELAQREIGHCRCDRVFCPLHRLPELHGCQFDHKEDGRREAREKMVKPTRHLGTSFRRLDSDS